MVDVTVLDDGRMQVTVDGTTWAPLPLEAVQALAARLPDAQAAAARQGLTAAIRTLTDVLVGSGAEMDATVEVSATSITATVDDGSFDRAQEHLGVEPDPTSGDLIAGPITIKRQPPPSPSSPPTPAP